LLIKTPSSEDLSIYKTAKETLETSYLHLNRANTKAQKGGASLSLSHLLKVERA